MVRRIWLWIMSLAPIDSGSICGNRYEKVFWYGPIEVKIQLRDTRQPDGYERTELYRMLRTVRLHEKMQHWQVPEPTQEELYAR